MGYPVTIFESLSKPGGMLRVGIPEYRLPKKIVDLEVEHIKGLGVEIRTNTTINKDLFNNILKAEEYRAVFIATGAHKSGDTWQTASGNWAAKNQAGQTEYFDSEDNAKAWLALGPFPQFAHVGSRDHPGLLAGPVDTVHNHSTSSVVITGAGSAPACVHSLRGPRGPRFHLRAGGLDTRGSSGRVGLRGGALPSRGQPARRRSSTALIHRSDSGRIFLRGQEVRFRDQSFLLRCLCFLFHTGFPPHWFRPFPAKPVLSTL
jgi:hypothetical protein